jgi:carbonic anhydrase
MRAVLDGTQGTPSAPGMSGTNVANGANGGAPNLNRWLRHALPAVEQLDAGRAPDPSLPRQDALSQLNVLAQVANVASYPVVAEQMAAGALSVHGWWFDIAQADVYAYEEELGRFVLIDEAVAERLVERPGRGD